MPFRVHGLLRLVESSLIMSFKLLQAQPQGQIHEGLLVRALLYLFVSYTPALHIQCWTEHAHAALTCIVLGVPTVQSRLLRRLTVLRRVCTVHEGTLLHP